METRGRTQDGNGDGSGDRNESSSGDGNGDGNEDQIGEGGREAKKRKKPRKTTVVDAVWDSKEKDYTINTVEKEKNVDRQVLVH